MKQAKLRKTNNTCLLSCEEPKFKVYVHERETIDMYEDHKVRKGNMQGELLREGVGKVMGWLKAESGDSIGEWELAGVRGGQQEGGE